MSDQWNVMHAAPPIDFLGRDQEKLGLRTALKKGGTAIVAGLPGAGKTSLANVMYRDFQHGQVYVRVESIAAHGVDEITLLRLIYRHSTPGNEPTPEASALPATISALWRAGPEPSCLLYLDNVEESVFEGTLLPELLRLLLDQSALSLLITTRADEHLLEGLGEVLPLGELEDSDDQLALAGKELRRKVGDDAAILNAIKAIGALPQNILYLRWTRPDDLDEFVNAFNNDERPTRTDAVRLLLDRVPGRDVLIACGLLRKITVSIELLQYFAEALEGVVLADLIAAAVAERLITSQESGTKYSFHPLVHLDLHRLSEAEGRIWTKRINALAQEFYALALRVGQLDMDSLQECVYHLVTLSEHEFALRIVDAPGRVDLIRRRGLSTYLESSLDLIAKTADRENAAALTPLERSRLDLMRAYVQSDLGNPTQCLSLLDEARTRLSRLKDPNADEIVRRSWVQAAISHGNLGETDQCIAAYQQAIALDTGVEHAETAACMGYLGYHYCDLLDFENADKWTRAALESCREQDDAAIFTRNLCNRGLYLYYFGDLASARSHFEQAEALVSDQASAAADLREHGRVELHLGLVYLAQPDVSIERVAATLEKARALCRASGDLRRVSIATSRLSLVDTLRENFGVAAERLDEAIDEHVQIGDRRSLAMSLLIRSAAVYVRQFGEMPPPHHEAFLAVAGRLPEQSRVLTDQVLSSGDGQQLRVAWDERHRWLYFARLSKQTPDWVIA